MDHFSSLHAPGPDRRITPPAGMWRELRQRLERLAGQAASQRRLKVHGTVDLPEADVRCALCVVIDGELSRVREIRASGRFRLDLPADVPVRLVFVQFGFLPRVIAIRPSRRTLADEDLPQVQRLDLNVSLTRSATFGGASLPPLQERITLSHGHGPALVEWDREPRRAHTEDFWPLLKRAS